MDASDYGTFETAFKRLSSALRLKITGGEDLPRTYFKLLEEYPLDRVLHAGRTCGRNRVTFPKPAEWIAAIEVPEAPPDVRQMTIDELAERDRAADLRYRDNLCGCRECARAGVDDQEIRYVPTLLFTDEYERAYEPRRKRIEIAGHWAHGEELARWYTARAACLALARRKYPKLLKLLRTREPGEEG